jgi:lipid-A-disaccharide synthase
MALRVALIAGEASGDQLGAELMRALRAKHSDISFEAVAGPKMRAEGCRSLGDIKELSVMGLTEVLKDLPRLLRLRRELGNYLIEERPDVVIGIDAPDFNLGLETRVRKAGIPTVHYVSPTVWAWRPGRVKTVARAADLLLCLFPFEPECYQETDLRAVFAGHPLTSEIPAPMDMQTARAELGLPGGKRFVALLPGSRQSEIQRLGPLFLRAARLLRKKYPELEFIVPLATPEAEAAFAALKEWGKVEFPIHLFRGKARKVMAAADVVLTASGTATMEAMMLERPTVVSYKVSPATNWLLRRLGLLTTRFVAMPNVLAGQMVMPELLQGDARPAKLAGAVSELLMDEGKRAKMSKNLGVLSSRLRVSGPSTAAKAILELVAARS